MPIALGACGPVVVVGMVVEPTLGTKAWGSIVLFMSIAPGFDWPIETAVPFACAAAGKKASKITMRRLRGDSWLSIHSPLAIGLEIWARPAIAPAAQQLFCDIRTEPALNAPFM